MHRAIVLGVHSFLDPGTRVGIQYIAAGLAQSGWQVDYLSVPSSPFDLHGRRQRLSRVWMHRQDKTGVQIQPGLIEYAFRTLYPAHKFFLSRHWLLNNYARLSPAWLRTNHYDLCIHDVTVNILFLHLVNADRFVLRLNDLPDGFAHHIDAKLIERFKTNIVSGTYDEIWAVSKPLCDYARTLNPGSSIFLIPNGIEDDYAANLGQKARRSKTAVFLGSISPWIDLKLLEQTALLMPDWSLHVYGPGNINVTGALRNLRYFPPLAREDVPHRLATYQVGLIPFRDISGRMAVVERPIKFYDYIAAGLGVASTDVGGLRTGMGNLAVFGNGPRNFAKAIVQAAVDGSARSRAFNRQFVRDHGWDKIIQRICSRITYLQGK